MAKAAPKKSTEELYAWDAEKRGSGLLLCGVDEAGRGPLAGDVFAAAVIFDKDTVIEGINDSKKLTAKKREELFGEIMEKAVDFSIQTATVEEIEDINILNAAMLAMKRAVEDMDTKPDVCLIDGNKTPEGLECPAIAVVKGDAKSQAVAAASILAKVARDRYMEQMAEQYPEYRFEKHKGYGTKAHCEAILQYGPCPAHRPSFLRKLYQKHENENN